ncbi:hypothetical protein [Thiothrix fructosivorans]|jgi:hypothetical protein|uniref:Uncharacterized protein n=1 Tax=Thiothrix fructosivorans TaxID=111770 RepID=A0A8B0SLS1_9GAMM|nr:hypothetical protein [Thiothrix fructosivorans]MBO0612232.1 hypothetical protein [Thiothrix fructosivorans]QTX12276.1 hypothetical protein J1836_008115 [Thiothrix fructosivorans]
MEQANRSPMIIISYLVAIFIIFVNLTGCAVSLISSYDEQTDKAVTALQKKTEEHFVLLDSVAGLPECKYEKHKEFYNKTKVDVSGIKVRVAAIPDNKITIDQTELLSRSFNDLESLHKISCLSKDQIKILSIQFNTSFTSILKLELAKRRN